MIISNSEANERLSSSLNLVNRLSNLVTSRKTPAPNPFGLPTRSASIAISPLLPGASQPDDPNAPTIDQIMPNAEDQIKLASAHDKAVNLLSNAIDTLAMKLDDVKPEKLPAVITAASKMVEGIRKERVEAAKVRQGNREVHLHFYTPVQKAMADYNVIEVG